MADALFAAILTDTGTFRFSNTDARALRAAADLIDAGSNAFEMHRKVFGSKTWGAGRMLGPVLSTLESAAQGRLAWISATLEMVNNAGATHDDMDGFADLVRSIKGVELVVFFKEMSEGDVKVSLRSNGNVDAHAIAKHFGGGGHIMASGMRVPGPLRAAIDLVTRECLRVPSRPARLLRYTCQTVTPHRRSLIGLELPTLHEQIVICAPAKRLRR